MKRNYRSAPAVSQAVAVFCHEVDLTYLLCRCYMGKLTSALVIRTDFFFISICALSAEKGMNFKMKKIVLVYLLVVTLLVGCNSDSDTYNQISSQITERNSSSISQHQSINESEPLPPQEDKELTGHLTIKSYWDKTMDTYIQDFMTLHPSVTIEIIQPGQEEFISFDDFQKQTVVELMSGNSADIIDVGGFSVYKYAKTELFCDLYSFMDSDASFNKNEYYTNIFEAKEFEGALYSLPCGFTYNMLYGSKNLLEKSNIEIPKSLNYVEMIQIYERVLGESDLGPKLLPGLTPYTFFYYEYPEYYNIHTQTASFSTSKFEDYLRLTKKYIPINEEMDFTRIGYDDSFLYQDYLFCIFDVSGGTDLFNFLFDFHNITDPIPMVSSSGTAYFRTMREYAIAESSSNKDLAWEFLKYYICEKKVPETIDSEYAHKYYSDYNDFVPINKANFFNSFKFSYLYSLEEISKEPNVKWKQGDLEAAADESLKLIHTWNQQRNAEQAEGEIYGMLCDDLNSYYYMDILTAEETANRLQNRMTIFLQE